MAFRLRRFIVPAILAILAAIASANGLSAVHAQDSERIAFNEPIIVSLQPGQTVTRSFAVLAGDSFELRLVPLTAFTFTAVLLDPDRTPQPLTPGADGSIVFPATATRGGSYQLVLQASSGAGELLVLVNSDAVEPVLLLPGETLADLSSTAVRYALSPQPQAMVLLLEEVVPPGSAPMGLPTITLANADSGEPVLTVHQGPLPFVSARLPAGIPFVLALEAGELPQRVRIVWNVPAAEPSPTHPVQPPPPQSQSGQSGSSGSSGSSSSETTAGSCTVYFAGAVNIRPGPGVEYNPPIGQALAGTMLPVTGHNGDYSWYQVLYNGQYGWVSMNIPATQAQGDCATLPVASYPPLAGAATGTYTYTPVGPTPTYTYTPGGPSPTYTITPFGPTATYTATVPGPTATYTATQPGPTATYTPTQPGPTATYTYTPSATYTYTYTPTYTPSYTPTTPPPVPIAPPDANFNSPLNIPLDNTASTLDFVSYPDGDRQDRVRWDITGMNPNPALSGGRARLTIAASCFGTGTQNIQFSVGGQTFGCGQTIVDREVTYDSRTGQVTITAVSGSGTYVQWVLTGTATRLN
ncbi:MAG: hypothetical protein Kow00106_19630 [Anaerolineae bacterium]